MLTTEGHRPVNMKRAVIGPKGGWRLRPILQSKLFRDWVNNEHTENKSHLLDKNVFGAIWKQHPTAFVYWYTGVA